jgi:hypothetical protein
MTAVSVRAGRFAYGCANLNDLSAGETRTMTIEVADRPMNLEQGSLDLSLAFDMSTKEWTTHLETAIATALTAFQGGTSSDIDLLLGAMSSQITLDASRSDFDARRISASYDTALSGKLAPDALRGALSKWLMAGASGLPDSSLEGQLTLGAGAAQFSLISAGGVPVASSGFLGNSTWNAFADPADTLVVGGALMFQATHWVVALAAGPAIAQYPMASNGPDALAAVANCDQIGPDLATASGGEIYAGCAAACASKLCRQALAASWAAAQNSGSDLSTLGVAVTGAATVDDEASPISLDGTWVGTLGAGKTSIVGGNATGTAAAPPVP